jgi:hypothetical protein
VFKGCYSVSTSCRERPDQEMIPELEVMPEDIAEVALMPFKMSKNVVLEEITVQTGTASGCRRNSSQNVNASTVL